MSGLRPPTPPHLEHGKVQIFCACRRNNDGSWQGDEFDCSYACGDILSKLKNKWNPYLTGLNQQWKYAEQVMRSMGTREAASREEAARMRCVEQWQQYEVQVQQITNTYKDHTGQNYQLSNSQFPSHDSFDRHVLY